MSVVSRWSFLVLCVCIAVAAEGQTIFQGVFHKPTYHGLRRIAYSDATTMYAIGDGGAFVRTTDLGATFSINTVSPGYEALHACDFIDAQHGTVCGDNGLVSFTSDAGTTWDAHTIPGARALLGVCYNFSNHSGFVVNDTGKIFYTADGAQSWSQVLDLNTDTMASAPVKLVAASRLTLSTYLAITSEGYIYRTSDGGQHWDSVTPARIPNPLDMYFLDATHGWIVAMSYHSYTTDGGATWNSDLWSPFTATVTSVFFRDATNGYALSAAGSGGGVSSSFYTSTDGGKFFSAPQSIGLGVVKLLAVRFDAAGKIGFAVGDGGYMMKSTNGGKNWTDITTGGAGTTLASSFYDDDHGMVCSYSAPAGGYTFTTSNGGTTWSQNSRRGENALAVAYMTGPTTGIALQNESIGQYTTDNGVTWGSCQSAGATTTPYRRMFGVNAQILYAVGQLGMVSVSTNGGVRWIGRSNTGADKPNLLGVFFFDATHGFVSGENGVLLKTLDAGGTYTKSNILTDRALGGVAFNTATSGWVVTDSEGVVFHTNDGGNSWQPVNIGAHDTLVHIVFASATTGWIGGTQGQLYMTSDGGTTWRNLPTGTSNTISQISYTPRTDPHTLWLSGGLGMVLKGDLTLVGVNDPPPVALPGSLALGAAYPNPFSTVGGSVSIAFSMSAPATARLDIVNIRGERVCTVSRGSFASGNYTALWDGRDERGMMVTPGAYFATLSAGGARVARSIVVTR